MWNGLKVSKIATFIALGGLLSACATVIPLTPGAAKVNIAVGPVPAGCKWRGNVDSDKATGPMSHESIQARQLNELKTAGAKVGANVVFVTVHHAYYYPQFISSTGEFKPELDSHYMSGKAYSCSPQAINTLSTKSYTSVSDVMPGTGMQ